MYLAGRAGWELARPERFVGGVVLMKGAIAHAWRCAGSEFDPVATGRTCARTKRRLPVPMLGAGAMTVG